MTTLEKARDILARHKEEYALWEIEEIIGDADEIDTTNDPYTLEELDIISDAINAADEIGKYGIGDLLFDIINREKYEED